MKRITKDLERVCGIYKITNLINNKIYIGSSKNLRVRLWKHRALLRHNKHCNPHLQNSWNKYGENNFDYSILELCDESNQYEREQYYIDTYHPEYNIAEKVELPSYSKESRKKHSETRKRMFREGKLIPSKQTKVYMYDLDGNFIKEYPSEIEASKDTGIYKGLIQKNLYGINKRCHSFMFKFNYSPSIPPYIRNPKDNSYTWKQIRVYNDNEEYFFDKAEDCCKYFNVHIVYIRDAIKNHRHFKRKYTIEYTTARQ